MEEEVYFKRPDNPLPVQRRGLDEDAFENWNDHDSEGEIELGSVKPSMVGVGKTGLPANAKEVSRRKGRGGDAKDPDRAAFDGNRQKAGSKRAEGGGKSGLSATGQRTIARGREVSSDSNAKDEDGGDGDELSSEVGDGEEGEESDALQPNDDSGDDEDEGGEQQQQQEEQDEEGENGPEEDAPESDTDTPPDLIRCKISFAPDEPIGSYKESWNEVLDWQRPPTTTIDDLDRNIRKRLIVLLKDDTQLLAKLHDEKTLLCYGLHIQVPHCGEPDYRPTESRHTFETIGDLVRDPSASGLELDVVVQVSNDARPDDVQLQPKYAFNRRGKNKVPAEELVLESQEFKPETDRWTYCQTRLGNVVSKKKSAPGIKAAETDGDDDDDDDVPVRTMLLGEWFTGKLAHPQDLTFTEVTAWDFGDHCIGDVHVCEDCDFSPDQDYLAPYVGVRDNLEIWERVKQRFEDDAPQPGSGVPFMPSHTLNDLDSDALGLGADLNGEDLYGIIRFVDHIKHRMVPDRDAPKAVLQPDWLPFDVRIDFEQKDGVDGVATGIRDALDRVLRKETGRTDDKGKALKRLLARQDWKLQIWVLPHKQRKMYRFPNGHAGTWNSLEEYLSKERVETGTQLGRTLYMEAHIVPLSEGEGGDESEGEGKSGSTDSGDVDDDGAGRGKEGKGKKSVTVRKDGEGGEGGKQGKGKAKKTGRKK